MNAQKAANSNMLLKEKAYQEIRQAILDETFQPGEFLSEKRLIDRLHMSKTPIKSALDRLETEGFVRVSPKQGIIVTELSHEKVRDIFELRMALEPFVCEQICGRLKDEEIARLEASLASQWQAATDGDEALFTKLDSDFHLLLCRFSGNQEIDQIMSRYQAHLYRAILRVIRRVPNRMQAAYEDHKQMFQALIDGDVNEAKDLTRKHLDFGKGILT